MHATSDAERSLPLRVFLRLQPLRRWPFWARYGASTLIVGAALAIRLALGDSMQGYPFLLGFPAVLICAALFNRWAGVYAAILCTVFWVKIFVTPYGVFLPGPGQAIGVAVFLIASLMVGFVTEALAHALAELVASEAQLRASVVDQVEARRLAETAEQEKDTLLRELAHRVRNDLNALAAMLRLRAGAASECAGPLGAAADQVLVFGRVHAKLAVADGDLMVDSRTFLEDLAADIEQAHLRDRPVQLVADIESHPIPSTLAVAFGLALNELVTNAMKHAFPERTGGLVAATFERDGDLFRLVVADDGFGTPPPPTEYGLGTRLLSRLSAQYGGRFVRSENTPRGVRSEFTCRAVVG